MTLYESTTVLVNLQCTFCWDWGRNRKKLAPMAFAASVSTESARQFVLSLDSACRGRVRAAARFTPFADAAVITYGTERFFVWCGLEAAKLSIPALSDCEILHQLDLMMKRGFRDWIHVDMLVEIETPEGFNEKEWIARCGGGDKVMVM